MTEDLTACLGPAWLENGLQDHPRADQETLAGGTDGLQLGKPQKQRRFRSDSRRAKSSPEAVSEECNFTCDRRWGECGGGRISINV